MFTEDPQATVAFSPSPGALPRSAGEVFYAQTPLWTSLLAAFALKEQFSPTALLGVAAFTASLGVAACPDDVPRRGGSSHSARGCFRPFSCHDGDRVRF